VNALKDALSPMEERLSSKVETIIKCRCGEMHDVITREQEGMNHCLKSMQENVHGMNDKYDIINQSLKSIQRQLQRMNERCIIINNDEQSDQL
jgi:hypothetical protein